MAEVNFRQGKWQRWVVTAGLLLTGVGILGAGPVGWKAGWSGLTAWTAALAVCWVAGVLSLLPAALVINRGAETLLQVSLLITGIRPLLTLAAGMSWFLVMRPMKGVYVAGIIIGYVVLLAWETRLIILLAREMITEKHRRDLAAKNVNICGPV